MPIRPKYKVSKESNLSLLSKEDKAKRLAAIIVAFVSVFAFFFKLLFF